MGSSNTATKDESDTDFGDPKTSNPESGPFVEGEKVLAYHGPCLYEAKVQKVELSKKEQQYFVHYLGWNKNWDEWVGSKRLLKSTEENIRLQKVLEKKVGVEKNPKSGRSTQSKPKTSTEARADKEDPRNHVGKSKKRKVESGIEVDGKRRAIEMQEKDIVSTDKHVKIQIPSALKKQLLDDCDFVTQMGKLVKLPRSPCADDIFRKYLDYKAKKDATIGESIGEILKGIRCYFDKAMPAMLLYKREHQQYREAIPGDVSPSSVYGAEHLLRLFVKLPEILAQASIEEETLAQLLLILHDFLKFLQKNQGTLFSTYDGSPSVEGSINEDDD
ncbi:hypothetical protein ACHQM5_016079 [Ranunculus cassubicifolius]